MVLRSRPAVAMPSSSRAATPRLRPTSRSTTPPRCRRSCATTASSTPPPPVRALARRARCEGSPATQTAPASSRAAATGRPSPTEGFSPCRRRAPTTASCTSQPCARARAPRVRPAASSATQIVPGSVAAAATVSPPWPSMAERRRSA